MKRALLIWLPVAALVCAVAFADEKDVQKKAPASAEASDSAKATSDKSAAKLVAELSKDVAKMRGLDFKKPVALALMTPEEMQAYLEGELDRQWPKEQFEADDRAYKALGLMPVDYDLRAGMIALYKEQAAGVYDPRTHRMLMPKDKGLDDLARVVLSHELTHALQDQHFDLSKLVGVPGSTIDHDMTVMMLIEGDATVLMEEYMQSGRVNLFNLLGQAFMQSGAKEFANAPPFLSRMLLAPYLYGPAFIEHYRGDARDGGWARVDKLYKDPPLVSKQAMHPGKYPPEKFQPVRVDLTEIPPKPADRKRCDTSLGEFGTLALLDSWGKLLGDEELSGRAARIAEGWVGDRLVDVESGEGGFTLIWASTWDSEEKADDVRDAAERWVKKSAGTGRVFRPETDGKPGLDVILVLVRPPAGQPPAEPKCPAYKKVPIRTADDLPGAQETRPTLAVPEVAGPAPKIDGVLDEAFWTRAASSEAFLSADGKVPATKARMLIARQGATIYLAVECFADAKTLAALKCSVKEHDSNAMWEDDEVEVFIDPSDKRRSYYHIQINPLGTTCNWWHPYFREADMWWDPSFASAAKVGEKSWVAEMALPVAIFDRTKEFAKEWAFNVFCARQAAGEYVFWSPVGTDRIDPVVGIAHKPEKFGTLTGLPAGPNPGYKPPASRVVRVTEDVPGPEQPVLLSAFRPPAEPKPASLTVLEGIAEPPAGMRTEWVTIGPAKATKGDVAFTVEFPAQEESAALFRVPRDYALIYDQPVFSVSSDFCVWAPYKELVIRCENPTARQEKIEVVLEDLTAYYLGAYKTRILPDKVDRWPAIEKYWLGQLAGVDVALKPGKNELRIPLGRAFRTMDGRRDISLSEIRGVGFRASKADQAASVRVEKISLEGGKEGCVGLAALWPTNAKPCPAGDKYPIATYEEMAKLGINDPNATHCPFSGKQINEKYVPPGEKAGALRIYPRVWATVTPEGADGDYPFEKQVAWYLEGFGLHHYASTIWESRAFLFYDLDAIPKDRTAKCISLRMPSRCYTGAPEKGKPWWPPMQAYEVADGGGNWDHDDLPTWMTQPPTGRLVVQSGLYRWNGESTRLWSFDLTEHVRGRLAAGKKDAGFSVRAMTSAAAWPDPHPLGHCNSFYGTGVRERDLAPYLYVEFGGAAPGAGPGAGPTQPVNHR